MSFCVFSNSFNKKGEDSLLLSEAVTASIKDLTGLYRRTLFPPARSRKIRILLSNFIVRMAAKSPFCLPSILLPEAMDKSGTPLRLMLRPPSFYQCPICQVLSSGLDGTWRQPKGVECGISKIANYNSS